MPRSDRSIPRFNCQGLQPLIHRWEATVPPFMREKLCKEKNMERVLNALLDYAEEKELIAREDRVWAFNRLLEVMQLDSAEAAGEYAL